MNVASTDPFSQYVPPQFPTSLLTSQADLVSTRTFPPLGPNLKVLMVWPQFPHSFWGFEGVLELVPEKSVMPPLGLITVAALCPSTWEIRLLDLTFEVVRDEDLLWADLVMVSSMQAQRVSYPVHA